MRLRAVVVEKLLAEGSPLNGSLFCLDVLTPTILQTAIYNNGLISA
jgi:hypothetical protein